VALMSMAEMIGDVFLCLCIICGIVVFTVANVNYLPEKEEDDDVR
jgi:hypothetical protein